MKLINLVVSMMLIVLLISCKDTGVSIEDPDGQTAHDKIKGEWILCMKVKEDFLTPDSAKDTTFFGLESSADSVSNSLLLFEESSVKIYELSDGGIEIESYEIDSVTDSSFHSIPDDYTLAYCLENDCFKLIGGEHVLSVGIVDEEGNVISEDIVEHYAEHVYYQRYSGPLPPKEWK